MAKPHVAILPSPGKGHVIPSLELAKSLVSLHGVQVSLFVPTAESSSAQTQLLHSLTLPEGLHLINLPTVDISNLAPTDTDLPSRITIVVRESLPSIRSAIVNSLHPPTVLIADMFGTDAFEIADDLKMAKYLFFTSNARSLAFMAYLPKFDREIKGEYHELTEPLRVPGFKPTQVKDLSDLFRNRYGGGYKCILNHAHRFVEASGILVNTFDDLEPQTLQAFSDDSIARQIPIPPVYSVGPIVKSAAPPTLKSDSCLSWLATQPNDSVLFVSFGSGGSLSAEQVTELAWGLEMSQQRFLWVVRTPRDTCASYLGVVGGSNDPFKYLPDGFLSRTQGVGLVVPNWAPQVEILSHGSIGGFLSHCGWNSTLESVVYGVPMIAWPLYAEQNLNALMLTEDLGVAVRSEMGSGKRVVGREEIEKMARMVMEGEEGKELRKRVKEVKYSALRALEKDGSSYNSLSQVVQKWKTK